MQTISLGVEFLRTLSRFRKKKENLSSYVHFPYNTSYSLIRRFHFIVLESTPEGNSHTLPIRVCAAQRVRDFEGPGLERGIHFRDVF